MLNPHPFVTKNSRPIVETQDLMLGSMANVACYLPAPWVA